MNYKVQVNNGKWSLYSPKIDMYVMQDVAMDEIKIAIATEMEYKVKLEIVKMLMTFPHGYSTMDDQVIVHDEAVKAYETWYHDVYQRIGFLEEYYALIDEKIREILL